MEADQADSPGDSSPDPELSRFIENMGLLFESELPAPLTPSQNAETRRVHRNRIPASLNPLNGIRQAGPANLPFYGTASPRCGIPGQPLGSEPHTGASAPRGFRLLQNSRVRNTV
jgi:hypothetical protein